MNSQYTLINRWIEQNHNPPAKSIKKSDMFHQIINATNFLPEDFPLGGRIFCIQNNITELPLCPVCGGGVKCSHEKDGVYKTRLTKFCSDACRYSEKGKDIVKQVTESSNMNKYGVTYTSKLVSVTEKRKATCIVKYGVDHAGKNESVKEKRKKTSIERYGVENPMQSEEVIKKIRDRCQSEYGVNWTVQRDDVQAKIKATTNQIYGGDSAFCSPSVRQKGKETSIKKYGVDFPMQSKEVQQNLLNSIRNIYGVDNVFHLDSIQKKAKESMMSRYGVEYASQHPDFIKKIRVNGSLNNQIDHTEILDSNELLESHLKNVSVTELTEMLGLHRSTVLKRMSDFGIKASRESESRGQREVRIFIERVLGFKAVINDRSVLGNNELDLYFPELKIAVEFNGVYWHSTKFRADRNYHLLKTKQCDDVGIQLIQIFEDEWVNNKHKVKSKIASIFGKDYRGKIYARNCEIVEVSVKDSSEFMESYHIQGKAPAKYRYGLRYNNDLVAVMTFNKGTAAKANYLELNRYATSNNVVGGFSKLLKHFWLNHHEVDSIVSFADKRYSKGGVYESTGWVLIDETRPSYTYLIGSNRFRREMFMHSKLEKMLENYDPNITEEENCRNHGIYRIYDCGLLKYEMKNPNNHLHTSQ
jgi:hypothetical protein